MKKMFTIICGMLLMTACTTEDAEVANTFVQENRYDKVAKGDYEINDCNWYANVHYTLSYDASVAGVPPAYYGGPITGASNRPDCAPAVPSGYVEPIITFQVELPALTPDQAKCADVVAYLELSNEYGVFSADIGYGHIKKSYPIYAYGNSDVKFNMNYIQRCDYYSADWTSDPTGSNAFYCSWNPYIMDCNKITGDKHFYYRIVYKYHDKCNGKSCAIVTKWQQFEWNI